MCSLSVDCQVDFGSQRWTLISSLMRIRDSKPSAPVCHPCKISTLKWLTSLVIVHTDGQSGTYFIRWYAAVATYHSINSADVVKECKGEHFARFSSSVSPVTASLTFRHRASCILGQAFRYSPENAFYIQSTNIYFIIWYLLDRASLIWII